MTKAETRAWLIGRGFKLFDEEGNPILVRANLAKAKLHGAYLAGVDLRSANLICANLRNVNLRGACLSYANLWGADLRGADLYDVNLENANLSCARLEGVDMSEVRHQPKSITKAKYDVWTKWPDSFDPQEHGAIKTDFVEGIDN